MSPRIVKRVIIILEGLFFISICPAYVIKKYLLYEICKRYVQIANMYITHKTPNHLLVERSAAERQQPGWSTPIGLVVSEATGHN